MEPSDSAPAVSMALVFELGLGVVALAIGWVVGQSPLVGAAEDGRGIAGQVLAIGWGLVATGPLIVGLYAIERFPSTALRDVQMMTSQIIGRMFGGATVLQLAAVAVAAGCGEELLFRGLVQAGLARWIGGLTGLILAVAIASVLFGICHWLNRTYAVLATLVGVYLGLIFVAAENVMTPITTHAAYDFVALIYLVRPQSLLGSDSEG